MATNYAWHTATRVRVSINKEGMIKSDGKQLPFYIFFLVQLYVYSESLHTRDDLKVMINHLYIFIIAYYSEVSVPYRHQSRINGFVCLSSFLSLPCFYSYILAFHPYNFFSFVTL